MITEVLGRDLIKIKRQRYTATMTVAIDVCMGKSEVSKQAVEGDVSGELVSRRQPERDQFRQ